VYLLSSLFYKNISLVPSGKSSLQAVPSCSTRGALANVSNAGQDAMDAAVLETRAPASGRRSRVVLTPRRRCQVRERQLSRMTVAKEPGHRGERGVSRKPLRAGTPGESGCNRGDYARVLYFISHARLRVRWNPAFPTRSLFRAEDSCITSGAIAPRECGVVFFRHCRMFISVVPDKRAIASAIRDP
jgi:hypothetical protein